ncbi:MAG: phosphate/phosphite/phosphonate ABC transporter substrate-binding protein, partial [Actinobacteria bacterium]|nr:phosphate/phosphite/phosphonate ABC transporter substrate-binding protein [Actinomycetota bacterium]
MKLSSTPTLRRFARVAAVAAFVLAISAPAMSQALTSVSAGQACTKAQLNRKSGTLTCTYNAKTKKYTWTAAAAAKGASTSRAGWPSKLVIAAVPSENVATMTLRYQNFVKVIEKETGLPTTFISATDYAGVIEAQVAGRADVVFYGPFSYVLAKARGAKIEAVGASVPTSTVASGYYLSYLVTKKGSGINSIKDVKGKNLCFVDAASTSGFLYPTAGLLENGIQATDYRSVLAGGHDKSVLAVQAGTCDAGFVYDDMFDKLLVDRGLIKTSDFNVVWKSGEIPNSPIAVRKDLPADLF